MQASSGVEPSLAELQERLDEAVSRENYQAAAELRDKITCGPAPAANHTQRQHTLGVRRDVCGLTSSTDAAKAEER